MAFRFADEGPPPPPKDYPALRSYSRAASVNVSSSASIMTTTTKSNNKLSIAALLTKIPNKLSTSSKPSPNDDGISLPWNFQHHVHVDEGYVGLPPSWLTSAFTEDEIAQIQARRTAVLHGVGGGGFSHNHNPLRPPSPTNSLYPSVIQGHRRNKSSIDSTASSSTPNLGLLPLTSESTSSQYPMSLSSTNLVSIPSSPSVPFPLRSPSPSPTNASMQLYPQQPPSTPSSLSFSLAPRNILSDLSSASSNIVGAVKSSAGKGMRIFRTKRHIGPGGVSSTSPPSSSTNRKNVHSRLSDETFFPPEIVSPDRGTQLSPTSPAVAGHVAPVWELYSTSNSYGRPGANAHHHPQPSTSSSQLSNKSSIRRPKAPSNPSSSSLSRTASLKNIKNFPNLTRSASTKSQSSLSSARSHSASAQSHPHPLPTTSAPPRSVPSSQSAQGPSPVATLPPTLPSSTTTTQPHLPHPLSNRPPHLMASHSHSASVTSLVSIPEASPAPGAVVPVPVPTMPAGFGKSSLSRKAATSKQHGGVNGSSSSRHHPSPSISSTSSATSHLSEAGSSRSRTRSDSHPRSNSQQRQHHKHTPSTSSQQSSSSANSSNRTRSRSTSHSNSSSHSISSSTSGTHSNSHTPQDLPMLSLSLPRMSLSLPFGEESFGAGMLGTGGGSTLTAGAGGGTFWPEPTSTATGPSFGFSSNLSLGMVRGDGARLGKRSVQPLPGGKRADFSSVITATSYASGSNGDVASGSRTTSTRDIVKQDHPPIPKSSSSSTVSTLTFPSLAGPGASSSTSNLTSTLRSNPNLLTTSTPNLTSTSTPNLLSTSTPTPKLSTPPSNTPPTTTPIPIPRSRSRSSTPTGTSTRTGTSPARRRPLPSSKPLPSYPVPALPSTPSGPPSTSLKDTAGILKLPVPPMPFSHPSSTRHHHLPSPLPVPPVASGSGPGLNSDVNVPTTTMISLSHPLPPLPPLPPPSAPTMFSPTTANNMLSPPLTAAKSATQSPNSAQLWSEIAQMMDPGMMSAIPGLHMSTALPEEVRDVVRRAGGEGGTQVGGEVNSGRQEGQGDVPVLVGDLVGPSPPVSAAELGGGVKEGSLSFSRVEAVENEVGDNDGDTDESEEYEDEESYDGVVQSASVVAALPHPHAHPLPQPNSHYHRQTQPLTLPVMQRVIEPLRTVGRPRLVNVNVNGLGGVQHGRTAGDVELELELDRRNISGLENRDTIRSSTATIVPLRGAGDPITSSEVNGQGTPQSRPQHHRPPSMKLVISNGIGHGMKGELSAMTTMATGMSGLTEGEGGTINTSTSTPLLAYYLEDGDDRTPSPLPSPGSALGSPLHDVDSADEGGSGSGGRFGFGFGSESTPTSSLLGVYPERRFEFGYGDGDDEYRLRYDDAGRMNETMLGGSESGSEDDYYPKEEAEKAVGGKGDVKRQTRALPLTTPTITLNDGAHSPLSDDGNTKPLKVPLNGLSTSIASSSSATDLASPSLSPAPSPFQLRYYGWVSTLVAPLSEFIDEAVDPRDHYLDLTEIAEGESGSVYAARVNRSNARKLKLGEVVRMQDLDDLGLDDTDKDDDDKEDDKDEEDGVNEKEKMKLVAIKSIALVPSGTPKLVDLERELNLMKGLWHSQVLSVDAVYVDLVEDSVWLRMELMERSLADVIVLVESGLVLQERTIARFASDVLLALEFLSRHYIAHRDVRSDNMLINNQGILKLADFTNAVRVDPTRPLHTDVVGVPYWQAPELLYNANPSSSPNTNNGRTVPPYDPLKLDLWSLGSTVWEMAETEPPFFNTNKFEDRWPPLSQPALYSPAFHEFLRKCSEPAASRPSAADLLQAPFINNACGRPVIVQLLVQCRTIECVLRETN